MTTDLRGDDLPPNIEHIRQLLAEQGPMTDDHLRESLEQDGRLLRLSLLSGLPLRWPNVFRRDDDGQMSVARRQLGPLPPSVEEETSGERWWVEPFSLESLSEREIVVLSVKTMVDHSGSPHISQIGYCDLSGGGETVLDVYPDQPGVARETRLLSLADALGYLDERLGHAKAVAGWRPAVACLPALTSGAEREGLKWGHGLAVLDVYELSLLVDPALASRTVTDLQAAYGATAQLGGNIEPDCSDVAELARLLLLRYDPADANWALSWRCLAEAGNAWARVLATPVPVELEKALAPCEDTLCLPESTQFGGSTVSAGTAKALRELPQLVPGFRSRVSQAQMAQAVAGALEAGGNVAVEAQRVRESPWPTYCQPPFAPVRDLWSLPRRRRSCKGSYVGRPGNCEAWGCWLSPTDKSKACRTTSARGRSPMPSGLGNLLGASGWPWLSPLGHWP